MTGANPSADAVVLRGVTKRFRRHRARFAHTTLKTALVERLRGRARPSPLEDPARFDVLKDVSLSVARGETLGVIGRNGAGKSTLLRLVAGILRPDAGEIETVGRVAPLIELGAGFHPDFTGRENAALGALLLGAPRREVDPHVEQILRFADLGDFVDAPVRTYSSGMYLRLAFSVAVHADPDVLLVDEVLAVGDEAFRARCRDRLDRRFRDPSRTTLLVTHDMGQVQALCDRVLVLVPPAAEMFDDKDAAIARYRETLGPVGGPA